MPNASSDKPWLQDFEQMLSRWAAHVRSQAEAGEQSPAAAALLDELLRSWAAFVQQPDDARHANQGQRSTAGQPPTDWLARTASGGPPAHWLAYIREKAPHLLDESGELRLTMDTAIPPTDPALPSIAADVPPDTVATSPVTDGQPPDPPPAADKPVATAVVTTPPSPDLPPPAALEKPPAMQQPAVRLSPAPLPAADSRLPTAVPAPTPAPTPRPALTPPDEKGAADEMHAAASGLPPAPPVFAAPTPPETVPPVSAEEIKREPEGKTAVYARQPLQLKPVPTRQQAAQTTPTTPAPYSPPRTYAAIHPLPGEEMVTVHPSPLLPPVEAAQPRQEPARLPQWQPAAQESVAYAPKPEHGRVPSAPDPLPPDPPPPSWQQAPHPTIAELPEPIPRRRDEPAVASPITTPSWPELPPDTPRLPDETPADNPPPWLFYRLALEQQRRERLDREQRGTQWNASPF